MGTAVQTAPSVGVAAVCSALGLPRASFYRRLQPARSGHARPRPTRALFEAEQAAVLEGFYLVRGLARES